MKTEKILLNGIWKMKTSGCGTEYEAHVPGTVLSVLTDNEVIDNPFYRMNEYRTRELFRDDYEFCREFEIGSSFLEKENLVLVCEGLDTLAEILINGKRVACTDNMHRTWRIPLAENLREGKNRINIRFYSPLRYIEEYQYSENRTVQYVPCGCMKGNHLLRKAHSMFGWDWGPQTIDMGIFRDIYLEAWSGDRIEDVLIGQEHVNGSVKLSVRAELTGGGETAKITACLFDAEGIGTAFTIMENTGRKNTRKIKDRSFETEMTIHNPRLWWPAGYGSQPLYSLEICSYDQDGEMIDRVMKTIGLRTLTVSREKDKWGREFAFQVNGVKIFAMGGNYIPEDCVYTRITEERQENLVKSMVRANYNCVRIWGGGYYPTERFYELCDRYGLIVWQDLMFACNVYEVTEHFAENCREEVRDNLKRFRHHACLGLICGNNEIESAWHHWKEFQKESDYLRADYIRLFEEILPRIVRETAPDIFYWPSSPSSGGCFANPDNENDGDTHYWEVWHGQKPFTDYVEHNFRFCSEFGFQSFPCIRTVEEFTEKEDRNIFSRVMDSHQKNPSANGKMLYYLSENFRCPSTLDHTIYLSQILQGMAVRCGVEHWRRHRGHCMGALYWQVNDNWPAPSWSSIDYFGRWKALHYMAKEFFARRAASLEVKEGKIQLYVENETDTEQEYLGYIYLKKMDLTAVAERRGKGCAKAFSSVCAAELDLRVCGEYQELKKSDPIGLDPDEELFIEGLAVFADGTVCRVAETLLPYKYLRLQEPDFSVEVYRWEAGYEIRLESDCFAAFVELGIRDADVIFSENYFHITEKEKKSVFLREDDIVRGCIEDEQDVKRRLQIRSVADTYDR